MFEEFKRNISAKLRNWLEHVRRTGNVAQWLLKDVYDDFCIYWESPEYKVLPEKNKKARVSLKGGSLHTVGAKSVGVIVREIEKDLGRELTQLEVFKQTHLKKKTNESNPDVWVEPRAENANAEAIDGVQLAAMSQQVTDLSRPFAQFVSQNEIMSKTVEELKKQVVSMRSPRHCSPSPDSSSK
ncbi:DNA binding protein -like protein [Capsicum annuum]|nr:DNA binding protein -like protein [Capsicum annuum]KAF3676448.1 DNA binding protein -like protein [Capsicum annuum]